MKHRLIATRKDKMKRNVNKREMWKLKIKEFMDDYRNSRQMPKKKDVIKVSGIHVATRHVLMTKREASVMFTEAKQNIHLDTSLLEKAFQSMQRK